MQRRGFLKFLGVGAATATVAQSAEASSSKHPGSGHTPTIDAGSGHILAIDADGSWRRADHTRDASVAGVGAPNDVVTLPGTLCHMEFEEPGLSPSAVGAPVYLGSEGRVRSTPPWTSGSFVVKIGILADAEGTVLFQPEFLNRRL